MVPGHERKRITLKLNSTHNQLMIIYRLRYWSIYFFLRCVNNATDWHLSSPLYVELEDLFEAPECERGAAVHGAAEHAYAHAA